MTTVPALRSDRVRTGVPTYVLVCAALAPVMVLTGWAFLAVIPVGAMTVVSWTDRRVRPLRWWTSLTAMLFAVPFTQYLLRAGVEDSMSKMLHPAMGLAIAAASMVVLLKIARSRWGGAALSQGERS